MSKLPRELSSALASLSFAPGANGAGGPAHAAPTVPAACVGEGEPISFSGCSVHERASTGGIVHRSSAVCICCRCLPTLTTLPRQAYKTLLLPFVPLPFCRLVIIT